MIELWGGVECTVNRVGDAYRDQLRLTGHHDRVGDLARIAALGIRTLRYPVLWERVAPDGLHRADWRWSDERLGRLRELGIEPIVTLVHHGSGPRSTSLLDPSFAHGLAAFAGAVAERYPWVKRFTPVNEPLTTARFSALYGHWYPHARDERSFVQALVNELRGVVLAMRAIRAVTPGAQLIQTEDFAAIHSTPHLRYQAEHENERRWLSLDLLTGRFERNGALHSYRARGVVDDDTLEFFREHPCPPDVVGLNYYLTSERLLDERIDRYPERAHGGNAREPYADIEAVRAVSEGLVGHLGALRLAWERYGLPLAFTEVHLGCTRDEQLRWLDEAWSALGQARAEGIDARALTAWSLFGAVDWNSLVTRADGVYEPGVFDVRGPEPRETGLARWLKQIAGGRTPRHPALEASGWWRRAERLHFPPVASLTRRDARLAPVRRLGPAKSGRPVLVTGVGGNLGRAFAHACEARGLKCVATKRRELDIADDESVANALSSLRPWAVINAAGYVHVDAAEAAPQRCHRENAIGPALLAAHCARRELPLVTFSSDLVFDGRERRAYLESDLPNPLSVYGRSKAAAERDVLRAHPEALVVRTSSFIGLHGGDDFAGRTLAALARGETVAVANDHTVSPTFVPELTHAVLDLLLDGARGLWHLANAGAVTWQELARELASAAGLPCRLRGVPSAQLGVALRPRSSVLGTARGALLSPLTTALARYLEHWRARASPGVAA